MDQAERAIIKEKVERRRLMLRRRRNLAGSDVTRSSQSVCSRLLSLPEIVIAPVLAIYAAFAGEICLDTLFWECKRQGKELLLPRYDSAAGDYEMVSIEDIDKELIKGNLGIREPASNLTCVSAGELADERLVWLVPGVAFDAHGNRIGHGQGYYDRLLQPAAGCKIGVAYDWQIVDSCPAAPHDVPMDILVSDMRVVRCRELTEPLNSTRLSS